MVPIFSLLAYCNVCLPTSSGCEDHTYQSFSKVGICIDVETLGENSEERQKDSRRMGWDRKRMAGRLPVCKPFAILEKSLERKILRFCVNFIEFVRFILILIFPLILKRVIPYSFSHSLDKKRITISESFETLYKVRGIRKIFETNLTTPKTLIMAENLCVLLRYYRITDFYIHFAEKAKNHYKFQ